MMKLKRQRLGFTSDREKRLWCWVLAVLVGIFSSLFISGPMIVWLTDQNVRAIIFVSGMALVGGMIILYSIKSRVYLRQMVIGLGLLATYLMLFLRLGLAERTHLIEYSSLAIFVSLALEERSKNTAVHQPSLSAFIITVLISLVDECLQLIIPTRHFDFQDIIFNISAILLALIARIIFERLIKK